MMVSNDKALKIKGRINNQDHEKHMVKFYALIIKIIIINNYKFFTIFNKFLRDKHLTFMHFSF